MQAAGSGNPDNSAGVCQARPAQEGFDADHPQDDPHPGDDRHQLAGAALMSGWLSVAMAGGGRWIG
jgi:hypothetical protein